MSDATGEHRAPRPPGPRGAPPPSLVVAGLLAAEPDLAREVAERFGEGFGGLVLAGDPVPFDKTRYYESEMGEGLQRFYCAFGGLVAPERLPELKWAAWGLEQQYAEGEQREEIFRRFREAFRTKTRDEWVSLLMMGDTCTAPVYSISEVVSDPNLLHRNMIVEVEHPEHGTVRQAGIMVKLSDTPGVIRHVDPKPGQFTEEILTAAGYTAAQIQKLCSAGVLD